MQVAGAWRQSRGTAGLVPSAWLEEPQSAHKWMQGCVGELTGGPGWTCGLGVSNLWLHRAGVCTLRPGRQGSLPSQV